MDTRQSHAPTVPGDAYAPVRVRLPPRPRGLLPEPLSQFEIDGEEQEMIGLTCLFIRAMCEKRREGP